MAVAPKLGVTLPPDLSIDAEVDLGPIPDAFGIAVRMNVHLPGGDREIGQKVLDAAHQVCPYSNATRGNVDVQLRLA